MRHQLAQAAGGAGQARHVLLLASVLGVSIADTATVGAIAGPLERGLGIGKTQVGLLVSSSIVVAALATLPLGALADRVDRVRLLTGVIVMWSLVMLTCGAASSFAMLLITRLLVGVLVATAGPVVASLTGDLFPAAQRGRIYGLILTGELLGIGVGFVVGGGVTAVLSWRWSFWVLALPGIVLAVAVHRGLDEPRRHTSNASGMAQATTPSPATPEPGDMATALDRRGVRPNPSRVIHDDPAAWSLWRAAVYLLRTRTVVALVVASGLGYFFLAGLKTFGVLYVQGRFGLGQASATLLLAVIGLGSLVGVQLTGRIADRFTARGQVAARPVVAGVAIGVAALAVVPGLLAAWTPLALGLLMLTTAGLGGVNPSLDAARLDLVHPRLWGRAEAVRTVLRQGREAGASLLAGILSTRLGAHTNSIGGGDGGPQGSALGHTFLILAVPLFVTAGLLLWTGRRAYPTDVATTLAARTPDPQTHPVPT